MIGARTHDLPHANHYATDAVTVSWRIFRMKYYSIVKLNQWLVTVMSNLYGSLKPFVEYNRNHSKIPSSLKWCQTGG